MKILMLISWLLILSGLLSILHNSMEFVSLAVNVSPVYQALLVLIGLVISLTKIYIGCFSGVNPFKWSIHDRWGPLLSLILTMVDLMIIVLIITYRRRL